MRILRLMLQTLPNSSHPSASQGAGAFACLLVCCCLSSNTAAQPPDSNVRQQAFRRQIQPLINQYCLRCHNAEEMKSGIRLDVLTGTLTDKQAFLWKEILAQVTDEAMPPDQERQPTKEERELLTSWIRQSLADAKSRSDQKNGSVRRLTVAQYKNTLGDLLRIDEDLTGVLPADTVSKDGFLNNGSSMLLSPLLIEAYFEIAEQALDLCLVDEDSRPQIQAFRMDLGTSINPDPLPERLILGANSHLLANQDFLVSQPKPSKPFAYEPRLLRTKYRFIEGYQGNATVRGWRDYDSIYHAVFACLRGLDGYPKGTAYESVPEGLLLRPAIPSAEIFGVESTYGPRANFKISLRELPDQGRFRVTVKAAKYDDVLLLDPKTPSRAEPTSGALTVMNPGKRQTIDVSQAGIYQLDVQLRPAEVNETPDDSRLTEQLVGAWQFNQDPHSTEGEKDLLGQLSDGATFVDSPFGKALSVDGRNGAVVVPRDPVMNVADGEFSVSAWIRPERLQQGGIVCLGKYSWTHGWYFDMPNNRGVLRIETANSDNQPNGTVASRPGVIRANVWQHVAAVVRRGADETRLYVNGVEVAKGTVQPTNLDNPDVDLHIGRIQNSQLFKGQIDDVRIYRRALDAAELQALIEPGRQFAQAPPPEKPQPLQLQLGQRRFSATLSQPALAVVRLGAGPLEITAKYQGTVPIDRIVLTPLQGSDEAAAQFKKFQQRDPRLGVHLGLRRDCGSTLAPVGPPQTVSSSDLREYVFEDAITNYPSPDVEANNVNYLAGIREIGVRSEYTDGRDMPRLLIKSVQFEGPYYESWPPQTHRNIFIESEHKDDPDEYAREVIRSFASRAFRRPITDREQAALFAVWEESFAETNDMLRSVKDALLVILTSPQFLFLIEDSKSPQPEPLDSFELASKLSYFLWNAAPDQRLLELAAANQLHDSLDAEIARLIRDDRFEQFAAEFTSQWLNLDKFDVLSVDRKRFPRLTRDTKIQLRQEPVQFVRHLIQHNRPLRELIDSRFMVANEVTANYYGLGDKTDSGFEFVVTEHGSETLGGVLTQAGILAGLSDGRESNPVKRGAWVARKIIAEPPDDPPPNVPALAEDDGANLTLREQLERHRDQAGCAKCHQGIDPWGLPFEQFDAGGLFKLGANVDGRSTLPDKTEVAGFVELRDYLANERIEQVAFSFLKHLAIYASGREMTYNEIEWLQQQGLEWKAAGYPMQEMVRLVVNSEIFLQK
jgi:hypothetical protein